MASAVLRGPTPRGAGCLEAVNGVPGGQVREFRGRCSMHVFAPRHLRVHWRYFSVPFRCGLSDDPLSFELTRGMRARSGVVERRAAAGVCVD